MLSMLSATSGNIDNDNNMLRYALCMYKVYTSEAEVHKQTVHKSVWLLFWENKKIHQEIQNRLSADFCVETMSKYISACPRETFVEF